MSHIVPLNVPSLRFPEFSCEWEVKHLSELGIFKSGVGFSELEQGGNFGVPFFKVSDMNLAGNEIIMQIANNFVDQKQIDRLGYKPITSDSVIFAKVGAAIFLERKRKARNFLIDNNMMAFVPGKELNYDFCFTQFSTIHLSKFAQVGALPSYNSGDIGIIKVGLPTLPEQQKIAAFLGAVDARAGLLGRRREALRTYKRGIMQRLFARELRFTKPDGSLFPDWQEKRLGEVAKFMRGSNLAKGDLDELGQFPAIHYGQLFTEYNEIISEVRSTTNRSDCTLSVAGDVLMPSSDVTPDGLARGSALHMGGVMLGGDINIIRPSRSIFSNFLSYWITGHKKIFMRLVSGTTVKHLYISDLKSVSIPLPHPEEQQKIADFLTALDAKIAAVTAQLNATQAF